jgi:hypothetical protein
VDLLAGVSDPNEIAFYRDSEERHVADVYAGAGALYQAGADAERSLRNSLFSSKRECESNALSVVSAAVLAVANSLAQASLWITGTGRNLHTWYGSPLRSLNPYYWFQ